MNRPAIPSQAPSIRPGSRLGPYEIVALLGEGGMGIVYRAKDARLGREVAVKVLPPEYSRDEERLRRFEREARATGTLNHPNILAIYDVGTHEGVSFVVSELLEGETLRQRLKGSGLPVRKSIEYAIQILRGLSAAHEKGIVHRDLKPENLFLTKDGRVKILDFGLAKVTSVGPEQNVESTIAASNRTESGVILGTIGYLAPEQIRGMPVDHRADLFAFGAVLYEMLSGRRAFEGLTVADTLSAILKEQPPDLAEGNRSIPPALERIVRHCLEKSPGERFQSAQDIAFDLESLSWTARSDAIAGQGRPRWKTWLLRVSIVLAVIVAIGIGVQAGRRLERRPPPSFKQLTFDRGNIVTARFAPDGETVFFGGIWGDRPLDLFSTRVDNIGSRSFGLPDATPLSISPSGEMAVRMDARINRYELERAGTLARVHIGGGGARSLIDGVAWADWAPDGSRLAIVRNIAGRDRLEFPIGHVLYLTTGYISNPRFSPRGDRIAFIHHPISGDDRGDVDLTDLGGHVRVLSPGLTSVSGLAWAPHGDEVWFSGATAGTTRGLVAVTLRGEQRFVSRVPGPITLQDISPSGRILITRDTQRLEIMGTTQGLGDRDLSSVDFSVLADLSDDGKTVLYSEEGDGGGPLYTAAIRASDGSPTVRIGEGTAQALSKDGKFALSVVPKSPPELVLLPTGAGESQVVDTGPVAPFAANFFPDGNRILLAGQEKGHAIRCYVGTRRGGWRACSPEGVAMTFGNTSVAPDARSFLGVKPNSSERLMMYPVSGGSPLPVPGILPGEGSAGWSDDGKSIYAYRAGPPPVFVYRVDLPSGRRTLWKEVKPRDPSGVLGTNGVLIARNGQAYVQCYFRALSDLFLVEGLR